VDPEDKRDLNSSKFFDSSKVRTLITEKDKKLEAKIKICQADLDKLVSSKRSTKATEKQDEIIDL